MNINTILNTRIHSVSITELLKELTEGVLFTPNVDHLVRLQKDEEFYNLYKKAEWVICDSKILNLAARFLNIPFKEVIPGSSLLPLYYNYHKDNMGTKMFLLGAKEGVALTAMENINNKTGRNIVVGAHSPSFGFEKNEEECLFIVDMINKSGASVLVVGVGAPKQEKWIMKHRELMPSVKLFMALGASIDFEAGNIPRAPLFLQKIYLEWLYRLIREPKRLWKRYVIEDSSFFIYIIKSKLGIYKDPFSDSNPKSY